MKVGLYAVLDDASAVFDGPVPGHNDNVAKRNFINMVRNKETAIGRNPEYFSLWRVGSWDDSKGEVKGNGTGCLMRAIDVKSEVIEED